MAVVMDDYVKRLNFSCMSAEEIRSMSVVNITETMLYERGLPRMNSVLDMRMGSTDRRFVCGTCKHIMKQCPGHTGKIEMATPVYNPVFVETTFRILRCVCFFCSKLLDTKLKKPVSKHKQRRRLATISLNSRNVRRCPHCKALQPNYSRNGLQIKKDFSKHKEEDFESKEEYLFAIQQFFPSDALSILKNISDEACEKLGFNYFEYGSGMKKLQRPENFIIVVLLCPSTVMRPSIASSECSRTRGHDDLTLKLQDIVKTNTLLHAEVTSDKRTPQFERLLDQLHGHLSIYMLNDSKNIKKPGNCIRTTNIRSISTRLKGKKGRIRGNLCGKRVDFSSRTVVSPDASIDLDELGVPIYIAQKQTIPETVTNFNLNGMKHIIKNGECNSVFKNHGKTNQIEIKLKFLDEEKNTSLYQNLAVGDVVERHLRNGDVVLFNRQPSLHAFSFMAHRVLVMKNQNTFRLNVQATTPYNADFDGDEMNMHVLQTVQARAEAQELMSLAKNLISPQASKPIIGLIQDVVLGMWFLTARDQFFDRDFAYHVIGNLRGNQWTDFKNCTPAILKPKELWTGKQLFSCLLPANFFLGPKPNKHATTEEKKTNSQLSDNVILVANGELLCGRLDKSILGGGSGGFVDVMARQFNSACVAFISEAQRMALSFLQMFGFTCSYHDVKISKNTHDSISRTIEKMYKNDERKNTTEDKRVQNISSCVDKSAVEAIKELRCKGGKNGFLDMVDSGSKGSVINLSQISGCVGTQMVCGSRIFSSGNSEGRTLPCFERGDHSPRAHGFVGNPYFCGINASEFYFHLMGGREGLVDTAVKTAQTGYISRRVCKMIESTQSTYTGSVIMANGEILQPQYYGDCFVAEHIQLVKCKCLTGSQLDKTKFSSLENFKFAHVLLRRIRKAQTRFHDHIEGLVEIPFNILDYLRMNKIKLDKIDKNIFWNEKLDHSFRDSDLSLVKLHLFENIGDTIDEVGMEFIESRIWKSRINAGCMPGTIAAQSLSQPIMQMTLNTFHSAGKGCKMVTAGVPRLREILDATEKISTPTMTLRYTTPFNKSRKAIKRMIRDYKFLPFIKIVKSITEIYSKETLLEYFTPSMNIFFDTKFGLESIEEGFVAISFEITKTIHPKAVTNRLLCFLGCVEKSQVLHTYSAFCDETWNVCCIFKNISAFLKIKNDFDTKKALRHTGQTMVEKVALCGHRNVTDFYVEKGSFTDTKTGISTVEYYVETSGCNLNFALNLPGVDQTRVIANNFWACYRLLGIEAVQNILFRECLKVLGDGVSPRHIMLVIDAMTFDGFINAVNRHGMSRTRASPLQRASFEEALDVLIDACTFGTNVDVKGITECVVMGSPSTIGSGYCNIMNTAVKASETFSLPFVGRRRKHAVRASDEFTSLSTGNEDLPWIASQNFEPFRKNITISPKTIIKIKAHIPKNTPRRFSFSLLPKEHNDASEILFHVSIRPTSEKKQLVLNSKHKDNWENEIFFTNINFPSDIEIYISNSKKQFNIKIKHSSQHKAYVNKKFTKNSKLCNSDDCEIQFETHDDFGNPSSWILHDLLTNTPPSPPSTPASTPPSTPASTPPSSPASTPPSSPSSIGPVSPVSSLESKSPESESKSKSKSRFFEEEFETWRGNFFFDKARYAPSSPTPNPTKQWKPSSP